MTSLADRFRAKLALLRDRDRKREIFGASAHEYALEKCLTAADVAAIEARAGVRLPDGYRDFLLHVGNGGAGPFYGIFPWGKWDEGADWNEDDGFVGNLARPFPHSVAWNLSEAELEPPEAFSSEEDEHAWHEALEEKVWKTSLVDGAIPIAHHGCGLRTWLVLTGPERGHVWYDARAENGGLRPHSTDTKPRLTFEEWYESWLDRSLATSCGALR